MARLLKWVSLGIACIAVLTIIGVAIGYAVMMRTVQSPSGQMMMDGLKAPVKITRDTHGIPHIQASNQLDAATALGFTHAQDRMWQMETLRMTGQGRLSEMFGAATVDIDQFLRSFGFASQVEKSLNVLTPNSQAVLRAYTVGVNAYLSRSTGLLEPALPPEFLILGHKPEPWKPEHSLLVLKIMSLQLSMNMRFETRRLALAAQGLSPEEIDDILPYHRDDNPPPLPDLRTLFDLSAPQAKASLPSQSIAAGIRREWLTEVGRFASNNWVIAGSNTKTGKPLLANDPHLGFGAPSLWYLAHLSWPDEKGAEHHAIGATIPALPAIVLGRNTSLAWGFTNAGADVQDLFVERVNPSNPDQYGTPDGWREFEKSREVIKVSGGEDVVFDRRVSRHGPILPASFQRLGEILPKDHVMALQWTGLSDQDVSFDVIGALAAAQSLAGFADLIKDNIAPMQAIVVADSGGNIGLFSPAALPLRGSDNVGQGRIPLAGWLAKNDWQGLVPPFELEQQINPGAGALGTANSKFVKNNSSPFLTFDWDESFRHDRVRTSIVQATTSHTIDSMKQGQLDSYSPAFVSVRDQIMPLISAASAHPAIVNALKKWDGHMDADKAEPLMMASLFRHIVKGVFDDDLGEASHLAFSKAGKSLLGILTQGGARQWCDIKTTTPVEDCSQIVNSALENMVIELTDAYGAEPSDWKWGKAHTVYNEHRPFSRVWPLSLVFTIEKPVSGNSYTLLRAKSDMSNNAHPYRASHGAGYRGVYDFSDLDKSVFVQTTGQSGNPFSPHYRDMADLWVAGNYALMSTKPTDYENNAIGVWTLTPPI